MVSSKYFFIVVRLGVLCLLVNLKGTYERKIEIVL